MLARERRPMPAGLLPLPAPLPNLRDALQRRAAIFGPVEADAAPSGSLGLWQTLGGIARRIAEVLKPHGAR